MLRLNQWVMIYPKTLIFLGITLFILINVMTLGHAPIVHFRDIAHSDTGVNLYMGNGFYSTSLNQIRGEFWSNHLPLYPVLLAGWCHLFGSSLNGVFSLNIALIILSVFVLIMAVRRLGLIKSSKGRLYFSFLMLLGPSMAVAYRSITYECLGILVIALALYVFSITPHRLKYLLFFILGILFSITSLYVILAAIVWSLIVLLFLKEKPIKEILSFGLGGLCGWGVLIILYAHYHVLDHFFFHIGVFSEEYATLLHLKKGTWLSTIHHNLTTIFLTRYGLISVFLALLTGFLLYFSRDNRSQVTKVCLMGAGLSFLAQFLLAPVMHYYFYLVFIPLSIGLCSLLSDQNRPSWVHNTVLIGTILVCLVGWPLRMAIVALEWQSRDYQPVRDLVSQNIRPGEWVFCDFSAYFPAKKIANELFFPTRGTYYRATQSDKQKITTCIIHPEDIDDVRTHIGGSWKKIGAAYKSPPPPFNWFGLRSSHASHLYDLVVYKRVD
jgi:hypothetical protein